MTTAVLDTSVTAIGRLRVYTPARAAAAQAIRRQLEGAEVLPSQMPPSALLVVRELADPLPGRLAVDGERFQPPRPWTEAARTRLEELYAAAERPRAGALADASEAVLFRDRAELAACLALDLARGTAAGRWWWQWLGLLLPELVMPAAAGSVPRLPRLLVALAREVPAVFCRLERWRAGVEVVARLGADGAGEVLAAVAAAHGVDRRALAPPPEGPEERTVPPDSRRELVGLPVGEGRASMYGGGELAVPPPEPWLPWLPPAARDVPLAPKQRCLLGVALALHGRPAVVRDTSFGRRARAWWRHQQAVGRLATWRGELEALARRARVHAPEIEAGAAAEEHAVEQAARDDTSGGGQAGEDGLRGYLDPPLGEAEATDEPAVADLSGAGPESPAAGGQNTLSPSPAAAESMVAGARAPESLSRETAASGSAAAPTVPAPERRRGAADRRPGAPPAPELPTVRRPAGAGPPVHSAEDAAAPQPEEPVAIVFDGEELPTRLGGVLYLIHALEELEIPAAFEEGWELPLRVGPWGALALIARCLLGERLAAVADDPLWRALQALGGEGRPLEPASAEATGETGSEDAPPPAVLSGHRPAPVWDAGAPAYRSPASWRSKLEEEAPRLSWTAARGRLWLWSAAGYLVASVVRADGRPSVQAAAEAARWCRGAPTDLSRGRFAGVPRTTIPGGVRTTGAPGVLYEPALWASAAAPAVARRLRLALGTDRDADACLGRLLSVAGRLYLTSSHVDLVADLDQIWLPARRAGLDRNPGWLADHGRVVLFHFQ